MNKKIIGIIIIVALVFLVYFLVDKNSKKEEVLDIKDLQSNTDNTSSTTVVNLGGGIMASGQGDFKVEMIKGGIVNLPKPIPDLSRGVIFSNSLNEEVKALVKNKILDLQESLKKNPAELAEWVDLGNYHKMAEDFQGAIIYWNYANLLAPDNFVSHINLADLYGYYLKDSINAEKYYNLAISKGSTQTFLYFKFAEFYRDVMKDKIKALNVVERGLSIIKGNKELEALRDSLK